MDRSDMSRHFGRIFASYFTATLVACSLAVSSGSAQQKPSPLAKFAGNWSGNGLIYLANGSKERIRCRGGFTHSEAVNIASLKMELRCAGDSYNFELQSD